MRVRAVVLNYNGGAHVLRCLDHLTRTEWPAGRFEIVVVDNASTDGSDTEIEERFPAVRLVRSSYNMGFPANNLALRDLDGLDYVALVNNDAFVEPDWLAPLVECLESDPKLGAACPKMLFEPGFLDLTISVPTFRPGGGDGRDLGVRVSGIEVDGVDVWRRAQFHSGFFGIEHGHGDEASFRWTGGEAVLRVPVDSGKPARAPCGLRLVRPARDRRVTMRLGDARTEVDLGDGTAWAECRSRARPTTWSTTRAPSCSRTATAPTVGSSSSTRPASTSPSTSSTGAARGCCSAVRYLREVGLFDERFFMYYEDTDLCLAGLGPGGGATATFPARSFRHLHAATSVEGSALFTTSSSATACCFWPRTRPSASPSGHPSTSCSSPPRTPDVTSFFPCCTSTGPTRPSWIGASGRSPGS